MEFYLGNTGGVYTFPSFPSVRMPVTEDSASRATHDLLQSRTKNDSILSRPSVRGGCKRIWNALLNQLPVVS